MYFVKSITLKTNVNNIDISVETQFKLSTLSSFAAKPVGKERGCDFLDHPHIFLIKNKIIAAE